MRQIDEIIIHCFDTPVGWMSGKTFDEKVAEVKRWHVEGNGWSDIGYQYLVSRKGETREGRPMEKAGAHCKGHNAHSIGISLEGGWGGSRHDAFLDNFTVAQGTALLNLIDRLQKEFGPLKVSGHYYYANKECPCFNVTEFLNHTPLKPEPKPKLKAKTKATAVIAVGLMAWLTTKLDELREIIGGLF